jgi:hypothetical protein
LPVVKKDERGVFVLVEAEADHGKAPAKPATAKPAAASAPVSSTATTTPVSKAAAPVAKAPAHKAGAQPNRQLFKRSTYSGVADTGPIAGETFDQKVARLKALAAAAKQRAEEGGGEVTVSEASANQASSAKVETPAASVTPPADVARVAPASAGPAATQPSAHKPTGNADRTLMKRSTYCGVVDTGPIPGESFEQKVERLRAVAAAAKQRAEEGGA